MTTPQEPVPFSTRRHRRRIRRQRRGKLDCQYQPRFESLEARNLLAAELVSVTSSPTPFPPEAGNDYSTNPVLSGDGRFVAFQSHASNLVAADSNQTQDVFVRDLELGTTALISINGTGTDSGSCDGQFCFASIESGSYYPAISDDGRYVTFLSHATDLVTGVTIDVTPNVFVRDRDADEDGIFDETGPGEATTTLLSIAMDGTAAGFVPRTDAQRPVISGNGQFVVFASDAPDLLVDDGSIVDTNVSGRDVYLAPVSGGAVSRVNVDGTGMGTGSNSGNVFDFSISETGSGVTFGSTNPGLVSAATGTFDDTNGVPDVFLGGGNGPVQLVSVNAAGTGPGNEGSREGVVSRNGRHVAFFSSATDLVAGATDVNNFEDLFVRDVKTGVTSLVSQARDVAGITTADRATPPSTLLDNDVSAGPVLSDDGRYIAFRSDASNLLDPALGVVDDNLVSDVFWHDRDPDGDGLFDEPGETTTLLVSINVDGTGSADHTGAGVGSAGSAFPSISRDGRYVAFSSTGRDLIAGGTPLPGGHVYLRDMFTGETTRISETFSGEAVGPSGTIPTTRPLAMSRDASELAFQTSLSADDLDASVVDPASGSPVEFGEIDVFAAAPPTDIVLEGNFATGTNTHRQSYRVLFDDSPPFEVGYYLSLDETLDASDTLLGTSSITDPDELLADGARAVTATIGTSVGEIPFPGIGTADPLSDYFILVVGDHVDGVPEFDSDPFAEDNTSAVRGAYHVPVGPVFVQGSGVAETIEASVTGGSLDVTYRLAGFGTGRTFTYDAADVSEVRIRTHGGNDTVVGSELAEIVFGGAGADELSGEGGDDTLFGGPGKDVLDGGEGADTLDGGEGPDVLLGGPGPDTLVDGPGDDLLDAGPDDDIVIAIPGSDNRYVGGTGIDTLDLRSARTGGSLDLDSKAKQTFDVDGNLVTVSGFENYVGSRFDDHVSLGPLPAVDRNVDGGDGQDTLHVDAGGNVVINDGSKLSFPGTTLGDIVYGGFEHLVVENFLLANNIVDNGDPGFTSSNFTEISDPLNPQGFDGDIAFADPSDGSPSTATWTFNNIPAGRYAVATTWTAASDRAKDAPYQVLPDGVLASTIRINQEVTAQEFSDAGVDWQNLGIFQVTGNSLTVQLSDDADEFVIADAVRIEPVPESWIVDDAANRISPQPQSPVVRKAAGPLASIIDPFITAFRADLGGVDNGDLGPRTGGTRTVNWDEVSDFDATPQFLPFDFYNTTFPRGLAVSTDGPGIQVSKSPVAGPHFSNLNSTYLTEFIPATLDRLMTPVGDNVTDVSFFVPGTNTPASVRGFGAVFGDVDLDFETKIEFFDIAGELLHEEFAPALTGSRTLSFVGVSYNDPIIASVRITSGNGDILPINSPNDLSQGGNLDLVVMDDFVYGEPQPIPSGQVTDGFASDDCTPISGPGFLGDRHNCFDGQTATWTFAPVPAGTYVVAATWTPGAGRSSSVDYAINGKSVGVDQQLPPDDFFFASRPWEELAKIQVGQNGTVPDIELSGTAPGTAVADAVQLFAAPDLKLFDPFGNPVLNGGTVELGQITIDDQGLATGSFPFVLRNNSPAGTLSVNDPIAGGGPFSVTPFDANSIPGEGSTTFGALVSATTQGPIGGDISFTSNDFDHRTFTFSWVAEVVQDVAPPTVQILSPDDGSAFIEGTKITIPLDVTDDGVIRAIDLFANGQIATTITQPPFDAQITLPTGVANVEIFARARDISGNAGDSAPITLDLLEDTPPTIEIVSPVDRQGVIEGSTVQVMVRATDDLLVENLEFRVDGTPINTEPAVSNNLVSSANIVIPSGPGTHQIEVCATDSAGQESCDAISIQVFNTGTSISDFGTVVLGPDSGAAPEIRVVEPNGDRRFSFFAYDPGFVTGVRVATGDVNNDGTLDIITAPGPGGGPHVKVFDGSTGQKIHSFFAYEPTFTGGVFVASGDVNGDGVADILTGAGPGGGPHVRVFDGSTGLLHSRFLAFDASFQGGVRVAAGDVNGDGQADIITGAGPGAGPRVRVFDGHTASQLPPTGEVPANQIHSDFFAFDPTFAGGVYVASGDINGDFIDDIIIGADTDGSDSGGHVKVLDGTQLPATPGTQLDGQGLLHNFFAYGSGFNNGVRVASGDTNNDGTADIITGPGPSAENSGTENSGTEDRVIVFDGATGDPIDGFDLPPEFNGSAVAASNPPIVSVVQNFGSRPLIFNANGDVVVQNQSGDEIFRRPANIQQPLRLNGSPTTDDTLVMRTLGTDIQSKIIFDGGIGGMDSVELRQGFGAPELDYLRTEFPSVLNTSYSTNQNDPTDIDALFVDLEPIDDLIAVVDREFAFADTDDNVVYNSGNTAGDLILRINSQNSEVVDFLQPSGSATVDLGDGSDEFLFDLPIVLLPTVDGGAGFDTFVLGGSGRHLDLTDPNQKAPLNIEKIDVIGASPNTLTIDGQSVTDATDANNTLVVEHDDDDTVNYTGNGWQVQTPIFTDGAMRHVLVNGGARVEIINQQPNQNPFEPTDVNFDGVTTPRDALFIINLLAFEPDGTIDFSRPTSAAELPDRYADVNGSRSATARDALFVINFVARHFGASGSGGESESTMTPFVRGTDSPNTATFSDKIVLVGVSNQSLDANTKLIGLVDWNTPSDHDEIESILASDQAGEDDDGRDLAEWDIALLDLLAS